MNGSGKKTGQLFDCQDEIIFQHLKDNQYYLRERVLRRFAYFWLIFDQLPFSQGWGKSVLPWMTNIWKNTGIVPPDHMVDEGGFETTILNFEILFHILGKNSFEHIYLRSIMDFFQKRNSPDGAFGPLVGSREGVSVQVFLRHTALATWFIGHTLLQNKIAAPFFEPMFINGVKSLFAPDKDLLSETFRREGNPVLCYMVCWHIVKMLKTQVITNRSHKKIVNECLDKWLSVEKTFQQTVLEVKYQPKPESLLKQDINIYPRTVPYSGFARMEYYSFLTSAQFLHKDMPINIIDRFRMCIIDQFKDYLGIDDFNNLDDLNNSELLRRRYCKDPLRIKIRGLFPYKTVLKNDIPSPDLGCTALMVRLLRNPELVRILWGNEVPKYVYRVRSYLREDLVDQFDSYLTTPQLYALTNAGMLANFIVGDDVEWLHSILRPVFNMQVGVKTVLSDNSIPQVLSEKLIDDVMNSSIVNVDEKVQVATFSLVRLLLDYLRPGLYLKDSLTEIGHRSISKMSLDVYSNKKFAEKFAATWKDYPNRSEIVDPFLKMLKTKRDACSDDNALSILDVGSGIGQYASDFIKEGYRVHLVDGSRTLLDYATGHILKTNGISGMIDENEMDLLDSSARMAFINKNKHTFAAIWCSGTLAHIPESAWVDILKWFYDLLDEKGIIFTNIMIGNPRVFAFDGRFFTYIHTPNAFISKLSGCGFNLSMTTNTFLAHNTYNEPGLLTHWVNFYANKSIIENDEFRTSSRLTALAYQRAVKYFAKVHPENPVRQKAIRDTLQSIKQYITTTETPVILDAGCGLGDHVRAMAREEWKVYGIDISNEMIEYCDKMNKEAGLDQFIQLFVADMEDLPNVFTKDMFDAIISVTVFQHLIDSKAVKVLDSFYRVLKPGGVLRIDVQVGRERGWL